MKKLNEIGETIIEIMMSIAVLGFTITVVFVIARNSLATGQAASERTQSLAIVESQLERLKYLSVLDNSETTGVFTQTTSDFCIDTDNNIITAANITTDTNCDNNEFPDPSMTVMINYSEKGPDASTPYDDDTFTITAEWTRVGADSTERIVHVYRIHPDIAVAQSLSGTIVPIPGCRDPASPEYNSAATVDDGSCTYPQPAPTCTIELDAEGTGFRLRWTTTNATSMTIGGVNMTPVAAGNVLVTPVVDTTYDGEVIGPGGTDTCSRSVIITTTSCNNGRMNVIRYAMRANVTGGDHFLAKDVADVAVRGFGPYLANPTSKPDIILDIPFNTKQSCEYEVDYTVWCSINMDLRIPGRLSPPDVTKPRGACGDPGDTQKYEAAYVVFYESHTGNATNAQCSGLAVAEFATRDMFIGRSSSDGIESETIRLTKLTNDTRTADCVQIEHVCSPGRNPALCGNAGNSLAVESFRWRSL